MFLVTRAFVALESHGDDRGALSRVARMPELLPSGLEPGHHLFVAAAKLESGRAECLLACGVFGSQPVCLGLFVACPLRTFGGGVLGLGEPRGDSVRGERFALCHGPRVRHRAAGADELGGGLTEGVERRLLERGR